MTSKFMTGCKPILAFLAAVALGAATSESERVCSEAVADAASLNVREIAAGYTACKQERNAEGAAFFLLLAKIRAGTDFAVLPPDDGLEMLEDAAVVPVLQLGNTDMDADFSRDVEAFDRVVTQVRNTQLAGPPDYSPGWDMSANAKP